MDARSGQLPDSLRETVAAFNGAERWTPLTTNEVAERLGLGRRSTYDRLERLVDRDRLRTKKVGARGRVWWIPGGGHTEAPGEGRGRTRESTDRDERGGTGDEHDLLKRVLDASPVAIGVFDAGGEAMRVNRRFAEYLGLGGTDPTAYALGEQPLLDEDGEVIPYPERPAALALATGEPVTERRVRVDGPDGRTRWLSVNAEPFEGDVEGVVVTMTDVTGLQEGTRRLERQRDGLEAELEDVFERISDGFVGLDEDLRFTYVNDHARALLGLDEVSVIGLDVREAFHLTDEFEAALLEARENQEPVFVEDYYEPLGEWFDNAIYPSEDGLSVYFRDVTERVEREQELVQYETLFEQSKDVNVVVDPDGTFRYVTPSARNVFGYEPAELVGDVGFEYIHPDDREPAMAEFARMLEDPEYEPTVEFRFEHADGSWIVLEASAHNHLANPDIEGVVIYTREVTARRERERELARYAGIIDAVGDPVYELDARGRLTFVNDAFVEQSGYDESELLGEHVSIGMDEEAIARAESRIAELLADGAEGTATLEYEAITKDGERIPVENRLTLLADDEDGDGDGGGDRIRGSAGVLRDVSERKERERELERQREQLAALNNVNDVVRGIVEAVFDQPTREEIERTVCEHLAATDSYLFAWVGDVDGGSETVTLRAEAGVEGYLDDVTVSVDPEDERSRGPTGRALRTGEVQTTRDAEADERHEPWRDHVREYGFHSSAAIPIVHGDSTYGVLNVYADRPDAFEGEEREVIAGLGEIVGHAIAATERKRALMSDELTEVEFRIRDVFEPIGLDAPTDGRITVDRTVPVGDGGFLEYGTATGDAADALDDIVDRMPNFEDVTVLESGRDRVRFEVRLSEHPVASVVASHGGYVAQATVEDGDYHMRIHLPPGMGVRRIVDAIHETYPDVHLLIQRRIARPEASSERPDRVFTEELSERQRATLEAAFCSGYFEWPRRSSAEDVADSMGVSAATLHEHLRAAERKLLGAVLSAPGPPE